MKRVYLCSPYRAVDKSARRRYTTYLRRALRDSMMREEAPFASHAFYPQILDDSKDGERKLGIVLGHLWLASSDLVAVYADYGLSQGMQVDMAEASARGKPIEVRYILRAGIRHGRVRSGAKQR